MATDTRERIIDTARQLFWEQGYHATSLAQIADRSGARTGSIYYFFQTKEAILEAVLDHYDVSLGQWLIAPVFAATADPRERIFGIVGTYRAFLVETHFTLGCPVGGLAIEVPDDLRPARARIAKIFGDLNATIRGCVAEMVRIDPDAPDPETLAALVTTIIEGGIVQARALRSIEPFDRSVECLGDYFDRLVAAG